MESADELPAVIDLATPVPLVVIGAGRAALHVVARLPVALHEDVMVVDPSGTWLAAFANRMAKHEVDVMRSPVTQVPFVNVLGLQNFAKREMRHKSDCVSSSGKYMPLPTTSLFLDYCAEEIPQALSGIQMRKDTVVELSQVLPAELERLQMSSGLRVHFASGGSVVAHQVVYCASFREPNIPACLREHIPSQFKDTHAATASISLAEDVDVRAVPVRGETVVILGGGMTAAQLACATLEHGAAQVVLVSRHTFKKREFEVDPMYFGNKGLYEFRKTKEPRTRLQMCLRARDHATINRHMWKRVQAFFKQGRLDIQQECAVTNVTWDGAQWRVSLEPAAPDVGVAPATQAQSADPPVASAAAAPRSMDDIDADDDVPTVQESVPAASSPAEPTLVSGAQQVIADRIWVAAGTRTDFKADPVLSQLRKSHPVRCVGGYPVLVDDSTLRWPGLPLYMMGDYTKLSIGPMASLMPGYRTAADHVVSALKAHALAALSGEDPYALPSGAILIDDLDDDDEYVTLDMVQQDIAQEKIAAIQGPKPTLKRPDEMDMGDLPEALPRRILENYSWLQSDDDMHVHILIPIEEPVTRNCVRAQFRKRSVEAWIVCEQAAYRFHISNLYKEVIPDQCYFKVNQRSQRVTLILKKYETNPWRFLRS